MAKKNHTTELSMDEYFNEELSKDGVETKNPFEVSEREPQRGRAKRKSGIAKNSTGFKRIMTLIGVVALLIFILILFILLHIRKNDGERYARLLSKSIGSSLVTAEKNAKIDLSQESEYVTLNKLYESYQAIAESSKTCKIEGVRLPEWAIFCNTDAEELIHVTYYNYELLEDSIFGTERKSYIDPTLIQAGSDVEQVENQLGLKPFRIQYLQGKTQLREYRYCYDDKETGDVVAYVIVALWDENDQMTEIKDTRRNYIGTLLASPDMG